MGSIGQEFFDKIVSSLCDWLGADCAIIGEIVDGTTVRALSMQRKGEIIHNYAYKLEGTPCSRVTQEGYCIFPEGVSRLFRGDEDLVELNAERYVGIPLLDKFKKPLGILNVISSQKLTLPPRTEQIMGITASRAAAEIERKRSEEVLLKSKELFQKTFETQRDAIFILNANKIAAILDFNPAAVEIFGYSKEEMVGRTTVFLHVNEKAWRDFQDILYSRLEGKDFVQIPEFRMKRRDGTIFYTEHSVLPLKDEQAIA